MLVRIGKTTDVGAGRMRAFVADGTKIGVANVDGRFHAFDDTCTHQGCSLATGDLEGTTVTCPCHGSQFDVRTGDVLEGPAEEPVASWAVEIDGDDLAVQKPG